MPRKHANWPAEDKRDKGKMFVINEMPSEQAEAWAMRALLALMASNPQIPEGFEELGMAGLVEVGFKALSGLEWEVAQPLLAEMMGCVQIMPNPKTPQVVRDLVPDDIEEVPTRFKLRMEVWKLHVDFFDAAAPSISQAVRRVTAKYGRDTKTSAS